MTRFTSYQVMEGPQGVQACVGLVVPLLYVPRGHCAQPVPWLSDVPGGQPSLITHVSADVLEATSAVAELLASMFTWSERKPPKSTMPSDPRLAAAEP